MERSVRRQDDTLAMVAATETNRESDARQEMAKILVYKEIAKENRTLREQRYAHRREMDDAEALDRDASSYELLFAKYNDDWELQAIQAQSWLTAKDAAQRHENNLIVSSTIDELLALVQFVAAHYVGAAAKGIEQSPWVPDNWKLVPAVEVLQDRYVLGEIVKYVRWVVSRIEAAPDPTHNRLRLESRRHEPPAAHESVDRPSRRPLRIVLLGPPFAGKRTQARLLADKYKLRLISVEDRIRHELQLEPKSPLGLEVHDVLTRGDELSPQLYSQLIVEAIAEESAEENGGWVVCDLPASEAHARSLEQQLTGFVEPSQIESPYDHDSILAPGCPRPRAPASFLHGKSGVDLAFHLRSVDASVVMERCLGHMEDAETHETCHLLHAPPSLDSTERHRLRHANASTNATALLSLQCLTTTGNEASLVPWYTRFATLREMPLATDDRIPRPLTQEAMHALLVEHIEAFYEALDAEKAATDRERELQDATAMAEEESRQLRLAEYERGITTAKEDVVKAQQAVQQAEEAKAKKEEIIELKAGVDVARKQVEIAIVAARDWTIDEQLRGLHQRTLYSGRLFPSVSRVLARLWDHMEDEYVATMTQCWAGTQRQRERLRERVVAVVEAFCAYVRRPDRKQPVVDAFQAQFNAVDEEMRFDDATKQELHARTDVLQDELTVIAQSKRQENDAELDAIVRDGWLEDTTQWLAMIHQIALQAECDRFRVSLQLLVDALYAASDDAAQLAGIVDVLKANPQAMDLSLKAFFDTALAAEDEAVAAVAPAAAADKQGKAGKAAPPAKGKAPAPAAATVSAAPAPNADQSDKSADALSTEELAQAYDLVLQRCTALVELILSAPPKPEAGPSMVEAFKPAEPVAAVASPAKTTGKTGTTPAATPAATPASSAVSLPRQSIDVPTSNLLKAVRYELELMQRRVRYLEDASQRAQDDVTRAMRHLETTLRQVIDERSTQEDAAIAAVVQFVRAAIERETDLPLYINVQPPQVYRFPTTSSLREDTVVVVDGHQRLVPRAPQEPPPELEPQHALLLNDRQRLDVLQRLAQLAGRPLSSDAGDIGLLSVCDVVPTLCALRAPDHALPASLRGCSDVAMTKLVAEYMDPETTLVDVARLVDALSKDEDAVRRLIAPDA
ncbi:hypothetical protein P43SY_001614 [Pythium insidiosum]|uniref:CPC1/SPEF2 domain-containing protein n=1 Tax=Pythium insidiosum TaxID=114742 RepID=A0AAD5QCG8_PYTIN|nr:hypothetical protein P43SY_001614 [Pythium insidiosum]